MILLGFRSLRLQNLVGAGLLAAAALGNPWLLSELVGHDLSSHQYLKLMLLALESLAFMLGICLLRYSSKSLALQIVSICISLSLLLLALEVGLRGFYWVSNAIATPKRFISQELGWQTTPNLDLKYKRDGFGEIQYSTDVHGFRKFGSLDSRKKRIFVLGDSYTQATQVSDGRTYYDVIEQVLDVEVFAYGSGGYGTLQEFLILDKFFDVIRPDLILWQASSNDFINNSHTLESLSAVNNNYMSRPYLSDGEIQVKFPSERFNILFRFSYTLRHLIMIWNSFSQQSTIETDLSGNHPLFIESATITSRILAMAKERAPHVPIVLFLVDGRDYEVAALAALCSALDFAFVGHVVSALAEAESSGISTTGRPHDSHWNENGHQIVGRVLVDYLRETYQLDSLDAAARSMSAY